MIAVCSRRITQSETFLQMGQQGAACLGHAAYNTKGAQLRDRQVPVSAGIDSQIGTEVHVDVQAQAVIAAAIAHPQTQSGDLGAIDIHPGCARLALCLQCITGQQVDDGLFQLADHFADSHA